MLILPQHILERSQVVLSYLSPTWKQTTLKEFLDILYIYLKISTSMSLGDFERTRIGMQITQIYKLCSYYFD